jgi:hypothetical protein
VSPPLAVYWGAFGFDASKAAPPATVGAVIAWLVTTPEGRALSGTWVEAQDMCRELGISTDRDQKGQ